MGAMASQITSLTIVYSTVYSGAKRVSNAENVSIWWRHHEYHMCCPHFPVTIGHIIGNPETLFMVSNDVSSSAWVMEYEDYVRIEVLASLRVDGNFRYFLLNWDV